MSLTAKGHIKQIFPVESGVSKAGKDWQKQEFIIQTQEQYPKMICFTLFGDKVNYLNKIGEGECVDVSFNVESREYNGRWFHNINAWKISVSQESDQGTPAEFKADDITPEREGDDLPF